MTWSNWTRSAAANLPRLPTPSPTLKTSRQSLPCLRAGGDAQLLFPTARECESGHFLSNVGRGWPTKIYVRVAHLHPSCRLIGHPMRVLICAEECRPENMLFTARTNPS